MLNRPVHLYVKTHDVTGLKYFGRTTENPSLYSGSGAYWTRHLQEYGDRVSTHVLGTYTDETELRRAALEFSASNNIAASTHWANLLPEDGREAGAGWSSGQDHTHQIAALDAAVRARMTPNSKVAVVTIGAEAAEDDGPGMKTFFWCWGIQALIIGFIMQGSSRVGDGYAEGMEWMHFFLGVGVCVTPIGWILPGIASWIINKLFFSGR